MMDFKIDPELQSIKQRFEIVGLSPLLNNAIRVAKQVAATDMSVLILGESGSGKESFSKIIHSLSARKHGQFIAINCGAIPEGTIDSELFGHEKGAFTGALDTRKGYFEVTNGGTIFLDEIGEMPQSTQARLLRVLENGEFIKVGSSKVQKTNVRVIAATNVELQSSISKSRFREDLYYRLSTVPIKVPPLRERGDDILLLFKKFAINFSETYKTKPIFLTEEAKTLIKSYRFPGNIRQLKNLVEQMSVLELEKGITEDTLIRYLPKDITTLPVLAGSDNKFESYTERDILYKLLFDMKKDMADMKKLVLQILEGNPSRKDIIQEHQHLFEEVSVSENQKTADSPPLLIDRRPQEEDFEEVIEDIVHLPGEGEEDSLSLEKKGKEMIIKALHKHKNKRKYAAQDLGISERTLYRKIKQYGIENA